MRIAILIGMCSIAAIFIVYQVRMMIREVRGRTRSPVPLPSPDVPRPRRAGLVIGLTDWGGVLVECDDDGMVLFLLPQLDESARERIRAAPQLADKIRLVVVINDPTLGGHLWTTSICEAFGIGDDRLHATVPHARVDRLARDEDAPARRAAPLGEALREGALVIERIDRNVVRVRHDDFAARRGILVGAAITEAQLAGQPIIRVIGTTRGPIGTRDALEPMLVDAARGGGNGFTLLAGTVPGIDAEQVALLRAVGYPVEVVEAAPAWVAHATAMVEAARGNDAAALDGLIEVHGHGVVAKAMISLIANGARDVARRLGETALAKHPDPEVHHQLAVLDTLAGEREAAERHLRAAIGEPPHAPSLINLAVLLARRAEDQAEAIALADRSVELMPDDPLAHTAAILTRAYAGRLDDARAKLAATTVLDGTNRAQLASTLDRCASDTRPEILDTFPMHAELAMTRGRELVDQGAYEDAIVALRNAHALNPLGLEIAGELGYALSQAGRDGEAIALYDAAIGRIPGGDLLRINRGNARRRAGDPAAALADYQALLGKAPELREARVGTILALVDLKRADDATIELAVLAEQGAPADLIAALRDAIERGTPVR